jgi:hypothetical protein
MAMHSAQAIDTRVAAWQCMVDKLLARVVTLQGTVHMLLM